MRRRGGGGVQLDIIFEKKKESAASKELVRPKQYAISLNYAKSLTCINVTFFESYILNEVEMVELLLKISSLVRNSSPNQGNES